MNHVPYIGQPVRRREDIGLITGRDRYVADITIPGALYLSVVRSPFAHAVVRGVNVARAERVEGVVAVFSGQDVNAELGEMPMAVPPAMFDEVYPQYRAVLAQDRVRYAGEPVAIVVAENPYAAQDAIEVVDVDYEPLAAVTDAEAALAPGAPRLYGALDSNLGIRWVRSSGDVDRVFADAPVTVEARLVNQRLLPVPMEPRAQLAEWHHQENRLTLWASTQAPHRLRDTVAHHLGLSSDQVRVIAPRVGGGFGAKVPVYPEDLLVAWTARQLRRPVRWIATRREDLAATSHGRDMVAYLRVAADRDGRIFGLTARIIGNLGSCLFGVGPMLPVITAQMITGCYDIPSVRVEVLGAFTNTMATVPYRGAGRPEAAYFIERMVDLLAAKLGLDTAEVRRQNFIPASAFPYQTATGLSYDSGNYVGALETLLTKVGYDTLRSHQAVARGEGRLYGIGLASYVEICGFFEEEVGDVLVEPDGRVTVLVGTSSHGQGHETTFAQLVADALSIPLELVAVVQSDTSLVRGGIGTFGSRSLARGGMTALLNARRVAEYARKIAAYLLEAHPDDIVAETGSFSVRGSAGRSINWLEVVDACHNGRLPAALALRLESRETLPGKGFLYPFGIHLAVVEVDRETGQVRVERYVTVDDSGPIVNPLLAAGQVHGGLAQGIGQALWEVARYDDGGQLVTGSLMDYAIPRADDLPFFETYHTVTPSPRTLLGVKGIGESATIGSTPAIANAVMDALAPLGVTHLDLPLTPERVWQAIVAETPR